MTVKELVDILVDCDYNRDVVISNVLNSPFATYSIQEVVQGERGPVYIRAKRAELT